MNGRLWRSAVAVVGIAATYALSRLAAAAALSALGSASASVSLGAEVLAGVFVALALVLFASQVTGAITTRIAVITLACFVSVAAVMIEGAAFAPDLSPPAALPSGLIAQLGVSVAASTVAVLLVRSPQTEGYPTSFRARGPSSVAVRVAAAALVYVVLYIVTGAINYALVTGPYYETHAGGLVVPAPSVVAFVAVIEGLMLTIGMIPLAWTLRGSSRWRAVVCGLGLFVLGGVVPLIQQTNLPDVLRIASVVEILFQKFPLGVAVAVLLGPPAARRS